MAKTGDQITMRLRAAVAVLSMGWAGCCQAAIGNVHVIGTTATQAVVAYTAPDAKPCTIQVSESNSLAPLAPDVDPAIFAGAASDDRPGNVSDGTTRIAVIGRRTAELASAGPFAGVRHFSRALQALTPHFGRITCGADSAAFQFTTTNIPLGNTYGDPWLSDATHPGDQPWPESIGGLAPESFVDPQTGVLLKRIGVRGQDWGYWQNMAFGTAYNQGQMPCDAGGSWSNPCSVVSGNGTPASIGNSTAWLVIRAPLTNGTAWNAGYGSVEYGQPWTLDQLAVTLQGYVNSRNEANRQVDVCLSLNGGASCASQMQTLTLGNQPNAAPQTAGQADTKRFGILPWLLDTHPRLNVQETSPHSGRAKFEAASGSLAWTSGRLFSLYWTDGGAGRIRVSAKDDACISPPAATTAQEYSIQSFLDGGHMMLSGAPPAADELYWCANNFAVMVRRHQAPSDNSSAYLQHATMAVVESPAPSYPDNGAGSACFNKLVRGGYFCLYGGLYWINPTSGASSYYGYPGSAGKNADGSPIANSWKGIPFPGGENADIDQTQSVFTFYGVSQDPAGGGPVVIQGVFNPANTAPPSAPYPNGGQIQNASVTSTSAYAVRFNNGLTFTNLSPQSTLHQSIVDQMAAFDPKFKPAMFASGPNGWNCSPAVVSAGVFYFFCMSLGADSPAWIIAYASGDGNPAHAGTPGGPHIAGAVTTFNTPAGPVSSKQTAAFGRSLHQVTDTGESGWVQIQMNPYPSISTSNIASIPASSGTCASLGVAGEGQCIQIDINGHTEGGVTGYEPYLAGQNKQAQFTGAPGELRTAQLGDTACFAPAGAGNCNWPGRTSELMTLVKKNADGHWIFRRNAYDAVVAIAKGPVTLFWISNQWSIPPGSTTANGSLAAYWSPLTGCDGKPDPHGDCMLQDTNNTSGHGEWRDGGEAVATNVPAWAKPITGWPTDYQTAVGAIPTILQLPFANVTPGQAAGVFYTNANPPFAGVAGLPWGFDAGAHPNAAGATASPEEAIRAFDNTPVQGGAFDPVFKHAAGQLFVATPGAAPNPDELFGADGVASINRKLMATAASCGSHPLIDVSGPAAVIPSDAKGSYSYCIARAKGECAANSTAGQIYVNCPGVVWDRCTGSGIHGGTPLGVGNDICVSNVGAAANVIRQFTLDRDDYKGAFSRTLVSATSRLRMVNGFENNRLLPDNSWLLFRAEWLNYSRQDMWMAKMLPYPKPDGIDRGTFVPVIEKLQPPAGAAVDNAVIEFGYGEYGGNCTSRRDACLAVAAKIGKIPFQFGSENPAGVACASGCTVAIPAISQRVLYWQAHYRDKAGNTAASGPKQAVVVQ